MPAGRLVRTDDSTSESFRMRAERSVDNALRDALCSEAGPLAAGAMPSAKCVNEAGQKRLLQSLDDAKATVKKPKREKIVEDKATEDVKPKTMIEWGSQCTLVEIQGPLGFLGSFEHL